MNRPGKHLQGLTLIEVLIAAAILVMVATMIWAAFDQTGQTRARLSSRQEHDHLARITLTRITLDLRSAFLSLHINQVMGFASVVTQFVGTTSEGNSRLDLTTFTHRRLRRNSHEGDACEVGYRVEAHRGDDGIHGLDLLRREAPRIDNDPLHGGMVDVMFPGITGFELRYYDDVSDQWEDTWDTSQATGKLGRLPPRVRVTVTLDEGPEPLRRKYSTETFIPNLRPLTFGLPIY